MLEALMLAVGWMIGGSPEPPVPPPSPSTPAMIAAAEERAPVEPPPTTSNSTTPRRPVTATVPVPDPVPDPVIVSAVVPVTAADGAASSIRVARPHASGAGCPTGAAASVAPMLWTTAILTTDGATAPRPTGVEARGDDEAGVGAPLGDTVHQHLQRLHDLGLFDGVVLVAEGDRVLLHRGYGIADRGAARAFEPGTVSTVGSITKPFTAAAVMALVEDGRLAVDDRVDAHLDGVPEDKASITVHQLLTHTAGLPGGLGPDEEYVDRDALLARAWDAPLRSAPGAEYAYSNVGYSILAALIEAVSGEPYEAYLAERVLGRADLAHTGYTRPEWESSRVATGYRGDARWGTVLEAQDRPEGFSWHLVGNGGLHSTTGDLHRFATGLRAGRILRPDTVDAVFAPHVSEGMPGAWYGYGWAIEEHADGGRSIGHNGGNGVFFADLRMYPGHGDRLYALLTNQARFERASGVLDDLLRGEDRPLPPDPASIDRAALQAAAVEHLRAFVEAYNDGADAYARFGAERRGAPHDSVEGQHEARRRHASLRERFGVVRRDESPVGGLMPNEAGAVIVDAAGERLRLVLEVALEPPHLVRGIRLESVEDGE